MSNDIEEFITDNRNDFDSEVPGSILWQKIGSALGEVPKKKSRMSFILKLSAAAAVLLMVSYGTYFLTADKKGELHNPVIESGTGTTILSDPPETNEIAQLIAMKQEELKTIGRDQPVLYSQFTNDIIQLDSSYKTLKDQLSITPNRELLIEAMIQNLQLQLNVLNQQLNIIHQIKESKKQSHEKNDQTI